MSSNKKMMFLIPKRESVPVRKPEGGFLALEGEEVLRSAYWVRRINDGDVLADAEAKKHKTKLAAAAKKAKAEPKEKGE
ncbi:MULTISPECIES: DUF2635 domain-containing protein [Vibrio harveyi group]|uniref:DUF2635 domain-containing protein n=1 Tax=Vibrio harveyi group TaxID=717610 RepID=UPI000B19CF48|nr:DUF2635 domain-containing protein [Vibrio harveyi]